MPNAAAVRFFAGEPFRLQRVRHCTDNFRDVGAELLLQVVESCGACGRFIVGGHSGERARHLLRVVFHRVVEDCADERGGVGDLVSQEPQAAAKGCSMK